MNPHRTCQENMDALKKVLTQRTLLALSRRNVEFVLAHQADSKQQLADYLRQCRAELGHIPGRTEVIGGDLIELRFRGWANALCASGVPAEQAVRRVHPALTKTDLFQKEFEAQRQLDKRTKAERKKANLVVDDELDVFIGDDAFDAVQRRLVRGFRQMQCFHRGCPSYRRFLRAYRSLNDRNWMSAQQKSRSVSTIWETNRRPAPRFR